MLREFPELGEIVEPDSGLIHCEMAQFVAHTQAAIDRNDLKTVNRCLRLVGEFFDDADPELKNAIYVSFLENLRFKKTRRSARALLGTKLGTARREVLDYLDELLGKKPGFSR